MSGIVLVLPLCLHSVDREKFFYSYTFMKFRYSKIREQIYLTFLILFNIAHCLMTHVVPLRYIFLSST